jgi:hypothetical protein
MLLALTDSLSGLLAKQRGLIASVLSVMIRIITCYSPYLQPLISSLLSDIPYPLLYYISLYLYILGYCPFSFLSSFLNLESSYINGILPPEPYLFVAFHLQGREIYLSLC